MIQATARSDAMILRLNYTLALDHAMALGMLGFIASGIDPCSPGTPLDALRNVYCTLGCDLVESVYRLDRGVPQDAQGHRWN